MFFLLWLVRGFTGRLGVSITPTFLRFPTVRDQPARMEAPERSGFDIVFRRGVLVGCFVLENFRYMLACCAATRDEAGNVAVSYLLHSVLEAYGSR